MDNKFLEEAEKIHDYDDAHTSHCTESLAMNCELTKKIYKSLLSLSSKHKEDVRALREAMVGKTANRIEADGWPEEDKQRWMGFFNAGHESAMEAFDSTLKDLGIEL